MNRQVTPPTLRLCRGISVRMIAPAWISAVILLFASKAPAEATRVFHLTFLLGVIVPALFNAILLFINGLQGTNDSVAENKIVAKAACASLLPATLLLPKEYWLAWVLAGLFLTILLVLELRLRTLNPERIFTAKAKARATAASPTVTAQDEAEEAAPGYTFVAEQAEHTLNDLAGMQEMKDSLLAAAREARQVARKGKHGANSGLRANNRNGILLYGDPGNGKTVFAEGLAGTLKLPIIKMSFGSVGSRWINNTTENVVTLFKDARAQAPCVLFMDEVDSVITDRNTTATSSEEGPKITNQILTELVSTRGTGVVILLATNFYDRLDGGAVREGRIDFKIQVLAPDAEARRAIIQKVLSETDRRVNCETSAIEQAIKRWEGFSVARIRAVVDEALRQAVKHKKRSIAYPDLQAALRTMQGGQGERLSESTPTLDQLHMPSQQKDALAGIAKRMIDIEEIERLGGSVPSGVMLAGPPGTGKTLAVRALAKTTGWPLLTKSGADLIADSKQIDSLMSKAKNARPCIVFIDEADDVFSDRRAGSNYSAAITNKLLTAMDGVEGKVHDILWVAAVNAAATMDSAAVRGGRFTEKVWFENPDSHTVEHIVTQWLAKSSARFDQYLTPAKIACRLEGESPANIQAILQQAVNIMIGRTINSKAGNLVSEGDLEAACNAVLG
jgi:transitional endoplasmic reticulum ATPase